MSLPPGRYLVQRHDASTVYSHEFELGAGQTMTIREDALRPFQGERLARKDAAVEAAPAPTPHRKPIESRIQFNVGTMFESDRWLRDGISVLGPPNQQPILTNTPTGPTEPSRITTFGATGSVALTSRLAWQAPLPAFAYRIAHTGHRDRSFRRMAIT